MLNSPFTAYRKQPVMGKTVPKPTLVDWLNKLRR